MSIGTKSSGTMVWTFALSFVWNAWANKYWKIVLETGQVHSSSKMNLFKKQKMDLNSAKNLNEVGAKFPMGKECWLKKKR